MKAHSRRIPAREGLHAVMRFVVALALALLAGKPDLYGMAPQQMCGVTSLCNSQVKASRFPRRTFNPLAVSKQGSFSRLSKAASDVNNSIEITRQDLLDAYSTENDLEYYSASDYMYRMNVGTLDLVNPQHWEMPKIDLEYQDYGEGVLPSETPYWNDFPSATHCKFYEYEDEEYYEYYTIAEHQVTLIGAVDYFPDEEEEWVDETNFLIAPFPLNINSTYVSGDSLHVNAATFIWDHVIVPFGFGTLTTPDGDMEVLAFLDIYHLIYDTDDEQEHIERSGNVLVFISKEGHQLNIWLKDGFEPEGDVDVEWIEYTHIVDNSNAIGSKGRLPSNLTLFQNYPNPFNPGTRIQYELKEAEWVSLKVFDRLGNVIAVLSDGEKPAGIYEENFDGSHLASGVYFCKLQTAGFTETRKLILMR